MATNDRPERLKREAQKKGRRIVMVGYFILVVAVTAIVTVEITTQVFQASNETQDCTSNNCAPIDCAEGIRSLVTAIDRARNKISASDANESQAIAIFRASLNPEWQRRNDIERACKESEGYLETLDAVVQLGFAEEAAVRREAIEIASIRHQAAELIRLHLSTESAGKTEEKP